MTESPCRAISWTSIWNRERDGFGLEHLLLPIRRQLMAVGKRREFVMASVIAPDLTVRPVREGYTRLADRLYLYESFDGSGFRAELPVDEESVVLDYPGLFRRVQ